MERQEQKRKRPGVWSLPQRAQNRKYVDGFQAGSKIFSPLLLEKPLFSLCETISSPAHGDARKCLIKAPYVPSRTWRQRVAAATVLQPCAPSKKRLIHEGGTLLLHNEAAIGTEQASLHAKKNKKKELS